MITSETTHQRGIAIDIDDTLSDTLIHFIREIQKHFKNNPENLSAEEIAKKYGKMSDIPYWQTPEIKEWLAGESQSNEAQARVAVMPGALEAIKKIHQILPVRMYITSRPSSVEAGTREWLSKNGFPEAEVITRPMSKLMIDGNAWKAEILEREYPRIVGIVDDNPEIITSFSTAYQGTVFLFGKNLPENMAPIKVVPCPSWEAVYDHVSGTFTQDMV